MVLMGQWELLLDRRLKSVVIALLFTLADLISKKATSKEFRAKSEMRVKSNVEPPPACLLRLGTAPVHAKNSTAAE